MTIRPGSGGQAMHRIRVDLNSDVGESFGPWALGADAAVLRHVTSASVACGLHAGDPGVMRATVATALAAGVSIGAHPGLPDLAGFGRRAMSITPQEAYDLTVYQLGALMGVASAQGARVRHVKPHGALYNMAAADRALAEAIARAVSDVEPSLVLFGLAGSALIVAGEAVGLATLAEAFPDRGYAADGSLLPRSHPAAIVHDPDTAAKRAVQMVTEGRIGSADGALVPIAAETLCIHGDAPGAASIAAAVRSALEHAGVDVSAPTLGLPPRS